MEPFQLQSCSALWLSLKYAIGYKKGYSREYMNKLVNTKYKKSVEDLSKEEYDYICNTLGE